MAAQAKGRIGYRTRQYRNPDTRVTFASYAIDEKKALVSKVELAVKAASPTNNRQGCRGQ